MTCPSPRESHIALNPYHGIKSILSRGNETILTHWHNIVPAKERQHQCMKPGNHPIIIMFLLRSLSDHVNTNPGHKTINTLPGNPRHLGINANSQWTWGGVLSQPRHLSQQPGWCPFAAPPLEPHRVKPGLTPSQISVHSWHHHLSTIESSPIPPVSNASHSINP